MNSYFSDEELRGMGIGRLGLDVRVDRGALLIGAERISLGDHTRVDSHAILSAGPAGIAIGRHVHLSAGVLLFGSGGRILVDDFASLSARCALYTASDDYTGGWMSNPTVPDAFRRVQSAPVTVLGHALVGAGCVILPGVTLGRGCSVGALSLIKRDVEELDVMAGVPAKRIGRRGAQLFELEQRLLAQEAVGAAS